MRIYLLLFFLGVFSLSSMAQKQYPSLLWEITKDDQKDPSYLYGTMHVSSRIAFSLSDSFFVALKSVDVVALESDPSQWMDEMEEMDMLGRSYDWDNSAFYEGDFYTNAFPIVIPESKDFSEMLRFEPSIVNGLLYRISGYEADFEEDTYLDLFIFQAGNKLGKVVMDLEDFREVQELSDKAEKEARKEKFKQSPFGPDENPYEIIENSYRKGDLDMLDSVMMQINAEAYNKYMLFERNENMCVKMDSIMNSGSSLFTGIGAAHLGGEKGVIEMLREKGYSCRPILKNITDASKKVKKKIDKTKVQLTYEYRYPSDSTFRLKLPGKLYELPMSLGKQTYIHPEMINGSNYSLVRLKTFNAFTGYNPEYIIQTVDSLLFENIPGEIIEEERITVQGHPGYNILNKTRRGDYQRYNIIALPNELLVFKLKGSRKFAKTKEASRFFESIEFLKPTESAWKTFQPKSEEFSVSVPGSTNESAGQSLDGHINLQTFDPTSGDFYMIQRNVLNDYRYIEEDKFELEYFMESIADANELEIDSIYSIPTSSYPMARGELTTKTGKKCFIQTALRGSQYYLILQVSNSGNRNTSFFDSFKLQESVYEDFEVYQDTSMYFSVETIKQKESAAAVENDYGYYFEEENEDMDMSHLPKSHEKEFFCEETGESIYVSYYKFHHYRSEESEAEYKKERLEFSRVEKDFIVNGIDSGFVDGYPYLDFFLTDTNSIRSIHFRSILKNSTNYSIVYQSDTLTEKSKFVDTFFNTFSLKDTTYTSSLFVNKADTLFNDVWGSDTTKVRQAVTSLSRVYFQDENAEDIIRCIEELSHKEFKLPEKLIMIDELGRLENKAIIPYLEKKYIAVDDSSTWQLAILDALSRQKTVESAQLFKKLILLETPFSRKSDITPIFRPYKDSLELAVHLFPEILEISRIDEYQESIYQILARLKDKGFVNHKMYEPYLKDIKWEARNQLKRLLSSEEEDNGNGNRRFSNNSYNGYRGNYYSASKDSLRKFYNSELATFNSLLYPYKDTDKRAKSFFSKQSRIKDEKQTLQLAGMDLIQGESIPDSMLCRFCESDKTRADFLDLIENFGIEFNDSCLNQQSLARSILFSSSEEKDSVTFIQSDTIEVKGQIGIVYFYKSFNTYNETWKLSYSGLFSADNPTDLKIKLNLRAKGVGFRGTTEEEKIKEIITGLKLYGRKRAEKKSQGFDDYYFYE